MPETDLAKRRRVMQRSMKLGHCICDPRRACPCEVFQRDGICPCAGDKPRPTPAGDVKLMQFAHNAGCASKIAAADLERVLGRLPAVDDPAVLSGIPAGDDAAIYQVAPDLCLVQTVDVMTPCVDDARTFGRICAANCLSDVYAMGGVPRTALSILAFPAETLDGQIIYEMMAGAMEVFAEAGVALVGGHSLKDEEVKLGFAITGTIPPAKAVRHETAQVGDVLVLTKRLGTGVLNFARQIGRPAGDEQAVARSMAALNRAAAEAMNEVGASACTDITGFGLFGHLISMCRHSGVTAEIWADRLPAFEGALEALEGGVVPGAVERNTEYVADDLSVAEGVPAAGVLLGFDAQTSGGLMIAVPADRHGRLVAALEARGVLAATIGRIAGKSDGKIAVTLAPKTSEASGVAGSCGAGFQPAPQEAGKMPAPQAEAPAPAPCCAGTAEPKAEPPAAPCCAGAATTAAKTQEAWLAMARTSGASGALDEKTKELINFALVVMSRCGPCLRAHHRKAVKMGITPEQLAEALWCAVFIGGAPVRMFYDEVMAEEKTAKGKGCCG